MKTIDEKLHPISVWSIYSRYFAKNFREHCEKFLNIIGKINTERLDAAEITQYTTMINKYVDFSKPKLNACVEEAKRQKQKKKKKKVEKRTPAEKEKRIEQLEKEARSLYYAGSISKYKTKLKLAEQLKKELEG